MGYRQIPKRLLIDTISIDNVEYSGVRIDHQNRLEASEYGVARVSYHMLFVDIKNTPNYDELKSKLVEGTKVLWNDQTLTVTAREILKTTKEHHLEVELK